jgi:cytochrome c oxidase assembly factor CtaG
VDPYAVTWDAETLVLVPAFSLGYALVVHAFPVPGWRIVCFAASQALILAVFVSPVETLSLHFLLTAHLLQNVVLAEWAPALFMIALPPRFVAGLGQSTVFRVLANPLVALPLWLGTYFAWHLPWVYDAALRHPSSLLHVEHACYFASGCLLWWPVVHRSPWPLADGAKAAYLFAAFVFASPLGLLLALLPDAVYSFYKQGPGLWGLSPLADQQIAGATMVAEQAVVFFLACAFFFLRFVETQSR